MPGDEATVTAADIARMAGVGRAAVSNWRRRYEDFPEPVGGTATSPAFSLQAVEAWLLAQGKVRELPLRERAWQQIRTAADDLRLGEVVAEVTELLRGEGRPRLVPPAAWSLVERYAAERGADHAVRFLLDRYADVHSRRLVETPVEVAEFMARLAGPDLRSVLDPACGLGVLLAAVCGAAQGSGAAEPPGAPGASGAPEAPRTSGPPGVSDAPGAERAYGQEADASLARLTRSRLALTGTDGEVRAGDSLRQDAWPGVAVDAVVCHPPFNERNWGYDELTGDPRWEYGLPPKTESELAWVQHALAHLEPGGVAVLLMPAIAAARRSGRRIRSNLLRRGALQAVIGLPPRMATGTGLPVHVWVLRRPAGEDRTPSHVLMAEAEPANFDAVADLWHAFRADPEADLDRPGESRTVPIIDLIDEDVDVTPSRHLGAADQVSAEDYLVFRERLAAQLERLAALVPEAVPGPGREMPAVALSELERIGALSLHQAGRFEVDGSGEPVLTDQQVFDGGRAEALTQPVDRTRIEPGDVVVAARGGGLAARVVEEPGLLLGPRLTLLRTDPDRLDPFFLAGFLRTLPAVSASGTQSGATRFDPRRAQVPRLALDEQRRYGDLFRRIFAFEAELRQLVLNGDLAATAIARGIAAGALAPPSHGPADTSRPTSGSTAAGSTAAGWARAAGRPAGPSVSCVFVCHDGRGRILLARRGPGARDEPGVWDCGAGALEYGESFEAAVAREVREEYSADVLKLEQVGVRNVVRRDPPSHWVAVVFAVHVDPAAVAIGEPHKFDELGWFTPDALPGPLHSQLPETLALFGASRSRPAPDS
jgi:ADP-ribose pyrophosphatase YjhB (NUDIX family)